MENRRVEILDAAFKVFCKKGFYQATIEDICKAGKISVGTVYTHFKNKREIMLAMANHVTQKTLAGPFSNLEEFQKAFAARISGIGKAQREVELEFQLLAAATSDTEIYSFYQDLFQNREEVLKNSLNELRQTGHLSPSYDPEKGAQRLNAILLGVGLRDYYFPQGSKLSDAALVSEFELMNFTP